MKERAKRASELLADLAEKHEGKNISLHEVVSGFRERGFSLLLMIFCAPTTLPFSPPGFTTAIALPLIFLSAQMILGMDSPWLPKWLGRKKVKTSNLKKIIDKINPFLRKLEFFLRPRLLFVSSRTGEKIIGVWCLICALSVALPLPFTNTIPSIGIFLMALGLLERDGLVIKAGMIVGAIGITVAGTVVFLGKEAITAAFGFLKGVIGH